MSVNRDPVRLSPEALLAHCLSKPGAWQDEPWEGDIVAKVGDKIFAFLGGGASVGVKCGANRSEADEWLLQFPEDAHVMAYIGRSGWNTLDLGGGIPDEEVLEAVDASYTTSSPSYRGVADPAPDLRCPT